MSRPLQIESAGRTHVGRRRTENEDRFAALDALGLYLVVDGTGGHPRGDMAARLAISTVQSFFDDPSTTWPTGVDASAMRLVAGVKVANDEIRKVAIRAPGERPIGATFAGVHVRADGLCVAHVGDSRCYRFRDRELLQLTEDHTLLHDLIWAGVPLDMAEARPNKHALTRVLGVRRSVDVTARYEATMPGDIVLLCTDGLTRVVDNPAIAGILAEGGGLDAMAARLITRANDNGGPDNVTCVLVRWPLG